MHIIYPARRGSNDSRGASATVRLGGPRPAVPSDCPHVGQHATQARPGSPYTWCAWGGPSEGCMLAYYHVFILLKGY